MCMGSIEMKRTNDTTGEHFRRGDVREDGYVFFAYTKRRKADGFFVEIWLSPEASKRATINDRIRHRLRAHGNRSRDTRSDT